MTRGKSTTGGKHEHDANLLARGRIDALIFDLDGVVTKTAAVHAAAWKALFDEFLRDHAQQSDQPFIPFDADRDYRAYVDGKPRYDGVRSFLASRDISLADGEPSDPPGDTSVCALGNKKNQHFHAALKKNGVEVYPSTIRLIEAARRAGFAVAIASSSKNCGAVLEAAEIAHLFDVKVDGRDLERQGLKGKPDPAMFLEAAKRLSVEPARAVVFEDAIAGVEAGRRGGFARVVGVDRTGDADGLLRGGADIVVSDLDELTIVSGDGSGLCDRWALQQTNEIEKRLAGLKPAVFLDYDGTLTPIVDRPELAVLSGDMKAALQRLAASCPVAIVSGRLREEVAGMVGIDNLIYAGSHGFDIKGPNNLAMQHEVGRRIAPVIEAAYDELLPLREISGVLVENKIFALAVHYRLVDPERVRDVEDRVAETAARHPELKRTGGKKVFELRPNIEWDKGHAVNWLLKALGLDRPDILPIYIGDDETDQDAFRALKDKGLGFMVSDRPCDTAAHFLLKDPDEVRRLLEFLAEYAER